MGDDGCVNTEMNIKQRLLRIRPHLILLLIPMLFTVLFGTVMSPVFVENIPLAVYDLDNSTTSRRIADSFYDCPTFHVVEGFESYQELEEALLKGEIHGAVILPDGFEKAIGTKSGTEAAVLVDGSNFLIGNNIQLYTMTILTMANANIQMKYLEAGGMNPTAAEQHVYTLNLAERALFNPQFGYFYYLFPGLLAIFVQQTILAVMPAVLIHEKKSRLANRLKGLKTESLEPGQAVFKIGVFILLNTISLVGCLILAKIFFAVPMNGKIRYILLIHGVFLLCLFGVSLVIASIFDDVTHSIQFVMFLAVPSFLSSGFGWPEYMMAKGFAPIMKAVWPLYYYANPMKDLMLKGVGWDVLGGYVLGGLRFALIWIVLGSWLYMRRSKSDYVESQL